MKAYLTPDDSGGAYLCRRLRFRAELASYISGALEGLTHSTQWEQFGSLTPAQAADFALEAFNHYLDSGGVCMVGTLVTIFINTPPEGILLLDGSTYNNVDYPLLAAHWAGETWDNGDGTFTVPDTRGRVLVHNLIGGEPYLPTDVGETVGAAAHTLTFAQLPTEATNVAFDFVEASAGAGSFALYDINGYGGGQPHNNVQPSMGVKHGVVAK